jgi:tetratricopeptide (TPR) repeat protein
MSQAQLLDQLHEWFADASSGGIACVLSGSPGAGKTHILECFLDQLPKSTPRLRGRGLPTGVPPLLPICEALQSYGGSVLDQLRAAAVELSQAVPMFKEYVGPLVRARERTQHVPSTLREAMPSETFNYFALEHLLEKLENGAPVVLFIDDIQWLDASSIAFLGHLARRLSDHKLLLLLARRTNGYIDDKIEKLLAVLRKEAVERVHELPVSGLTRPEQHELIETTLLGPIEFKEHEFAVLEVSTQAKPYQLLETIQYFRDRESIAQVSGVWRFVKEIEPMLPTSLRDHLHHRMEVATEGQPSTLRLIRFAACGGTEFDATVLAACVEQPSLEVVDVLQRIEERSALIRRVGSSTKYRFDHDLTREAILSDLGELARELHAKLAETMAARNDVPASSIAHQFDAAGDNRNAATWYLDATRGANVDANFRSAVQYGERADRLLIEAGLPHHDAERVAVTTALGEALFGAEQYPQVVALLEGRISGVAADEAISLLHILGRAEARVTNATLHNRAVEHLSKALHALPEPRNDPLRAKIHADLVNAYDVCGDYRASDSAYKMAIAAARRANDEATLVRLVRLSCIFWQPDKVVEQIETAIEVAKRLELEYELALCENNLGSACLSLCDLSAAAVHYSESARLLGELGGHHRDTPVNNLGLVKLFQDDTAASLGLLREASQISADPHNILFIQSNIAAVEAIRGNVDESLPRLESAVAAADASVDPFYRNCIGHNLASALMGIGQFERALTVLEATPLHHSHDDEVLVVGKRAMLLVLALEGTNRPIPEHLDLQVRALKRSTKPQAWLYKTPWYLYDMKFLGD